MKFSLFALVTFAVGAAALAVSVPSRPVVNPTEQMVITPGLTHLGKSRISTVEACEGETKTDHTALRTDSEFENFERCLVSYN